MRNILYILLILSTSAAMAQEQLNDYKYIIVPKQFEEFKRVNQYQTSTLMKYLLTENGFNAVYEDELPEQLANNRCLGLKAKLIDSSSMFTTKASVVFEDCNGKEIYKTREGTSKEKDYKDSYGETLRDALGSLDAMQYNYNGKADKSGPITVSMNNDVKNMDEDKSRSIQSNPNQSPLVKQEATMENQRYVDLRPTESNMKMAESKDGMQQEGTQENQRYEDNRPEDSRYDSANKEGSANSVSKEQQSYKGTDSAASGTGLKSSGTQAKDNNQGNLAELSDIASATLYAQELPTGYQLVDSTPKIRMKIYKTSMPDFYLAKAGSTPGVVFQKNGAWFLEYYDGDKLMSEELEIKF